MERFASLPSAANDCAASWPPSGVTRRRARSASEWSRSNARPIRMRFYPKERSAGSPRRSTESALQIEDPVGARRRRSCRRCLHIRAYAGTPPRPPTPTWTAPVPRRREVHGSRRARPWLCRSPPTRAARAARRARGASSEASPWVAARSVRGDEGGGQRAGGDLSITCCVRARRPQSLHDRISRRARLP